MSPVYSYTPAPVPVIVPTPAPVPVIVKSQITFKEEAKSIDVFGLQELQQQRLLQTGISAIQGKQYVPDVSPSVLGSMTMDPKQFPNDHFSLGPKYAASILKMKADYQLDLGHDLTSDQIKSALYSEQGFLIQSMTGFAHFIKFPTSEKLRNRTYIDHICTSIYNPDSNLTLDGLGIASHSIYLGVLSINHFNSMIQEQLVKVNSSNNIPVMSVLDESELKVGQTISNTLCGYLLAYQGKCSIQRSHCFENSRASTACQSLVVVFCFSC
jgi:hypothetical protein